MNSSWDYMYYGGPWDFSKNSMKVLYEVLKKSIRMVGALLQFY